MPELSSALITGTTGFIGSRLARRLLESEDGTIVTSLVRSQAKVNLKVGTENSRVVMGDLTDKDSLKFEGNFDVVYHLASLTPLERNRNKLRLVNYDGTRNFFDSIRDKTRSFVYVSGLAVFAPETKDGIITTVDENAPKNPNTEFVKIRLETEEFLRNSCEKAGIDFTVVYFPDIVYGDGGYFSSRFLEPIRSGKFRMPGSGQYLKNFIHLDDAVDFLITIANRNATNQTYIATDSSPALFADFVNHIADQFGSKHPGSVPLFLARMAVGGDLIKTLTTSMRASNEKVKQIYAFKYPSYIEGIPQVVASFRSRGSV